MYTTGVSSLTAESFPLEIQSGHAFQLYVEKQAVELRMFRVGQERFGGGITDRLEMCSPQQSAQRTSKLSSSSTTAI
jgi:hypothetical protein